MKEDINFICKTAFLEIRRISTIRNDLSDDATKTLVVSLVFLRTDYCNSLGLSRSVLGRQTSESPKLCRHLHWLPVRTRISYKTACPCFNAITSSTPAYLSDFLHLYSPSRSLRSSADTCLLKIPLYKCKTKGDRAFSYFGPSVWNSLPLHIRNATTIDTFKSALKIYLFNLQEFD